MGKVSSADVYRSFEILSNLKIRCTVCPQNANNNELTKTTTVAKNHLVRKHPELDVSKRIREERESNSNNKLETSNSVLDSANIILGASKNKIDTSINKQEVSVNNLVTAVLPTKSDKKQAKQINFDKALFDMALLPSVSINSFTSTHFQNLVSILDPAINVLSKTNLTANILVAATEKQKELKCLIDSYKSTKKFNLVLNLWRSHNREFLAVNLFINKKRHLISVQVINESRITTKVIQGHLNNVLKEYNLSLKDNICGICIDGATNVLRIHETIEDDTGEEEFIIKAENYAQEEKYGSDLHRDLPLECEMDVSEDDVMEENSYRSILEQTPILNDCLIFEESPLHWPFKIHCFAHQLNLFFCDIFKNYELNSIIKLISILVRIKGRRYLDNEIYLKSNKRILLPSQSRWYHVVNTIDRAIELREEIDSILRRSSDLPSFGNCDWNVVTGCSELLSCVKFAIDKAESDCFYLADVVPCLKRMEFEIKRIKSQNNVTKEKIQTILETQFTERFGKFLCFDENPMYYIATFLEPSYRKYLDMDIATKVTDFLVSQFNLNSKKTEPLFSSEEEDDSDSFEGLLAKKRKLDITPRQSFLNPPLKDLLLSYFYEFEINETSEAYWTNFREEYFVSFALSLLSTPASSAAVGNLFAVSKLETNELKNRTAEKLLEAKIFLRVFNMNEH